MEINELRELANKMYAKIGSKNGVAKEIISEYGKMHYANEYSANRAIRGMIEDNDLIAQNVRLAKQKQYLQDTNRIERKAFREYARVENSVSEYAKAIKEELKKHASKFKCDIKDIGVAGGGVGVMHFTDMHGNELIDLEHNQYNFGVLAQRTKKYVTECLEYFKFKKVKSVFIAFGGDLLNSDRRADESQNQATNRSKASVLMSYILAQVLTEVSKHYKVEVVGVMGNESRVNKEMSYSNEVISDNYDFTILAQTKMLVSLNDRIKFISIDKMEHIAKIGGQKWLIAHDVNKYTDTQAKTQSAIGRKALQGDVIDFIIGGHIHSFRCTDYSCRSGSFAGSNTYNEHSLNLAGRASGVCYVVQGKSRSIQYIDLQYCDNRGYDIIKAMEAYNIKSKGKCTQNTKILEIVI